MNIRYMQRAIYLILYITLAVLIGCTSSGGGTAKQREPKPTDTLYTRQKAMEVYAYQPERALLIIDSAEVMGNVDAFWADLMRARIYSQTCQTAVVDSLLSANAQSLPLGEGRRGSPIADIRLDSARAIGERLLRHDSAQACLALRQDVLEMLLCTARQQKDAVNGLRWARQLVSVCHQQGAETEALRNEAEIGVILCFTDKADVGLARIDSVIGLLDSEHMRFNELDATIIALKRKINALDAAGRYVETLSPARRIIDQLNDYEQRPGHYRDSTYREPVDATDRADYIRFYRTQAQGFITAAYAAMGQHRSMEEVYDQIERSVRDATAREHLARYQALEQQMLRREAENRSRLMTLVNMVLVGVLVLIAAFAAYIIRQNRRIGKKNRALARMIETHSQPLPVREGSDVPQGKKRAEELSTPLPYREGLGVGLFQNIDSRIRTERLYARADLNRQAVCDLFSIRREQLSQLLSEHTNGLSFPAYINSIRLSEACRLLSEQPQITVVAVAAEVGLTLRNLRKLFSEQYGMTPTEYRRSAKE